MPRRLGYKREKRASYGRQFVSRHEKRLPTINILWGWLMPTHLRARVEFQTRARARKYSAFKLRNDLCMAALYDCNIVFRSLKQIYAPESEVTFIYMYYTNGIIGLKKLMSRASAYQLRLFHHHQRTAKIYIRNIFLFLQS